KIARVLRAGNVMTELYPDAVKLKKQLSYADAKKIPYIVMAGGDEIKNNSVTVKVMATGEQKTIALDDLDSFSFIKNT
ncbi:MAG TPA: His/Gly/Thr/Pro-type tRNA ligase C-terminal domain-containing protein, partial [Bacteroidales bacterium]|nr:His/Gly/Thr/Pro-type tRNA ligase C-terminal domain-containing protein [Bacteroidales bacterium]